MKESENKKNTPLETFLDMEDFLEDKDKDKDEDKDEGDKEDSNPFKKLKDRGFGSLIYFWE